MTYRELLDKYNLNPADMANGSTVPLDATVEFLSFGILKVGDRLLSPTHCVFLDDTMTKAYEAVCYFEDQAYINGDWSDRYPELADEFEAKLSAYLAR